MKWQAQWIKPMNDLGEVCPIFYRDFKLDSSVKKATLHVTALGVYEATLNGKHISDEVLAPGWTTYRKRLQYQTYDVTDLLATNNQLCISVGKGWYRSRMVGWQVSEIQETYRQSPAGLFAQLEIEYYDNIKEIVATDERWQYSESPVRFSELYDGETYDGSFDLDNADKMTVSTFNGPTETLISQEGAKILETESLQAAKVIKTPKGEVLIDFGQEVTGYVEINVTAKKGEEVRLSHGEVLDKDGNFYNDNYRSAKAKYLYICKGGQQRYKPKHTFYGFRYVRVDAFPGGIDKASLSNFEAIVVHSDIKRTGYISSSNSMLNQLFDNIFWGQRGNFLDVPTDCPQRDERLGWTGDAQVFVKAAALNYDVEQFFYKWLGDLAADQKGDGSVGHVIPNLLGDSASAAWDDAATICPWEIYMAYGNPSILKRQYESMTKWVDYITNATTTKYLWTGGTHFGDWLGLDAPSGSYKGSSREDLIATAFYAYSTSLVIKAGKVIGKNIEAYEALHDAILSKFQDTFTEYKTQTECVLAAHFNLATDCQKVADQLADMVKACGVHLETGFVGTPYLLHVLSNYGHNDLAYRLLLRKEYPSWLYSVNKGATTVWEHWDGIMEDGGFWSKDMNSYNHYAYGAVADWVYTVAAGINTIEKHPGYEKIIIAPKPDPQLDWLNVSFDSRHGLVRSNWKKFNGQWRYEIETPVDATIIIDGKVHEVNEGLYTFYA